MVPIFFKLVYRGWSYAGTLDRKYNVLCGWSSTGKTSFVINLARDEFSTCMNILFYNEQECINNRYRDAYYSDKVILVPEMACDKIRKNKLEKFLNEANTRFLFINRDKLPAVKISYKAFYEWHRSGKYSVLKSYYPDYTHIKGALHAPYICEGGEGGSEYEYYTHRLGPVESASGKDNIPDMCNGKTVLADGADYGRLLSKTLYYNPKDLFLPESFEEMVCRSINPQHKYVQNPLKYCTLQTNSLETFYEENVNEIIKEKGYSYSKSKCSDKIKELDLLEPYTVEE